MWNSFALAVQALTLLPVQADLTPTREEARRAMFLFPLIGGIVGVLLGAVWTGGSRLWTGQPLVPAALTLAAGLLVTGGRGLGGIARAADGLTAHGGGGDRTRAFAVMRDPRRGTTGLIALGAFLALRLAFLAALPGAIAWPALVLAGVTGGWAVAFAYSAFPVAATGESGPALAEAGPGEFLAATVIAIVGGAVLPTRGLLTLLAVALVAAPTAAGVNRLLGGLNRPLCAALGEIAEIVALACLSIRT
jgi:adenosylcobinamide-GDP ribazoletransferase